MHSQLSENFKYPYHWLLLLTGFTGMPEYTSGGSSNIYLAKEPLKRLALGLSLLIATESATIPASFAAASSQVSTPVSTLEVTGNTSSVGDLSVLHGEVVIRKQHTIDIRVPQAGTGVKKTALSGAIFSANLVPHGKTCTVSGLAYFSQGSSMTAVDDPDCEELISVEGGETVQGRIVSINHEVVTINTNGQTREIPVRQIKRICSPRVYKFAMTVPAGADPANISASSANIRFTETTHRCKKNEQQAAAPNDKHPVTKNKRRCCGGALPVTHQGLSPQAKITLIGISMIGIATAIALPIALGVSGRKGNKPPPFIFPPQTTPPSETPPPPPPPPPHPPQPVS
jgi:hypothetical protein